MRARCFADFARINFFERCPFTTPPSLSALWGAVCSSSSAVTISEGTDVAFIEATGSDLPASVASLVSVSLSGRRLSRMGVSSGGGGEGRRGETLGEVPPSGDVPLVVVFG